MRLCADTRGPIQGFVGGSRGAVVALLLLLLLTLSQAQSMSPQNVCTSTTPQSLKQPHYHDYIQKDPSVCFMSTLVQSFLHTVQPNPFPHDLIFELIQQNRLRSNEDIIKDVLLYELGFQVCLAIGVLYIILTPTVGLILACCRCCGNCGGKMYQKQTSSTNCHRRALFWSTFITTSIILAGNICMFKSNEDLKMTIDRSPVEVQNTIDNINTFLVTIPQQIDFVVNESHKTVDQVARNLNDIGPQLGTEIQNQFSGTLNPALNSVKVLDRETVYISDSLKKLNSSLEALQSSMAILQVNVTAVKNRINQTLFKPNCVGCNYFRDELEKLTLDTSISMVDLSDFQSAVDEVVKSDLTSRISQVEDIFQGIPQLVTNDTKDLVRSSMQVLGDIKAQISRVRSDIPLSSLTKNVSGFVETAQTEINNVWPQVENAEYIRWAVCVTLCCVVLLVVVCNILGLVLGYLGLIPKADPTKRSCSANCGGTFLMMGAGFSFIFGWLFMIAVLILFLLGGNVHTLVCRPWSNGQLLEFIDTPGLIPGLDIDSNLGLKTDLNISGIYGDCAEDKSLWTTLHLHELIDLDDLLNVSKYTDDIKTNFENIEVSLSSVVLLSTEDKALLKSISAKAEVLNSVFNNNHCDDRQSCTASSPFLTSQHANFSSDSLNVTANELDRLAAAQTDVGIQAELNNHARDLRQIQANIELTIIPQHQNLSAAIKSFEPTRENINETVGDVLSNVGGAQDFLNTNTTQIVKTESRKFLDCQLDYFISFADWAKHTLTQQVGRCGPVAGAVDSVEIVLCDHIVESLNAFWFSLGWCMIFFIPSIIFSIKLSKYYRRMKYSDVYTGGSTLASLHEKMNHIPRAQVTLT